MVLEGKQLFTDLVTGEERCDKLIYLKPYGFLWALTTDGKP